MRQFKTLSGKEIPNVVDYIKEYLKTHKNIEILIGCDAQKHKKNKTVYGIVIVLYTPGKGGHVLCTSDVTPYEKEITVKLINEVWKAVEIAEYLRENGIPQAKWIDIDLNPDPRYQSNKVLRQAIGLVEGMGYHVRWKNNGALVNHTADKVARKEERKQERREKRKLNKRKGK
jgi:predicted RNase H-related nuclease YkuK (DUF458 family)